MSGNDGSESVEQFLARVASLQDIRDHADTEKNRRMEEEILKTRKERQARRAERARSLSPSKTGPAATSSRSSDQANVDLTPPVDLRPNRIPTTSSPEPTAKLLSRQPDANAATIIPSSVPSGENADSSPSQRSATSLARSGTLSWQQKPISRDGSIMKRPLSGTPSLRLAPKRDGEQNQEAEIPSRRDISASLSQKDPAWFTQTQDRAVGLAALRKSQVEDTPRQDTAAKLMKLPGMSSSYSDLTTTKPSYQGQESRSEVSSTQLEVVDVERSKREVTPDIAALRRSMVLPPTRTHPATPEPRAHPDRVDQEDTTQNVLARNTGILSRTARSTSPTKGFGGFVESAMMKRSDSVSKRWSVQADTGLRRGDSVAGMRSAHTRGLSRDIILTRDTTCSSPLASSRQSPSHEGTAPSRQLKTLSTTQEQCSAPEKVQPDLPETSPRRSATPDDRPSTPSNEPRLARSPSKTMDSRRWSPTKSTWLESMLSTTIEAPKLQPLVEEQPKWKVDLQRSKSKRGQVTSQDNPLEPSTSGSTTVSLLSPNRQDAASSTLRAIDANESGIAEGPKTTNDLQRSHSRTSDKTDLDADTLTDNGLDPASSHLSADRDSFDKSSKTTSPSSTIAAVAKPSNGSVARATAKTRDIPPKPPVLKPKPQTPPKLDFRTSLRPKPTEVTKPAEDDAEFKSVFGKLKRTTTQNYVAPDVLKKNILSGKAALNVTDGPQKTLHRDEFKESILAKKDEWKAAGAGAREQRVDNKEKTDISIPEALQRRKTLSRPNNTPVIRDEPSSGQGPQMVNLKPAGRNRVVSPKPNFKPASVASKRSPNLTPESSMSSAGAVSPEKLVTEFDAGETTSRSLPSAEMSSALAVRGEHKPSPVLTSSEAVGNTTSSNNRIANRLNPNLAAVIARGPVQGQDVDPKSSDYHAVNAISGTSDANSNPLDNESLTHTTKGRAKGPKRRAPKAEPSTEQAISGHVLATKSDAIPSIESNERPIAMTYTPPDLHQSEKRHTTARSTIIDGSSEVTLKPLRVVKAPLRPLPQPPAKPSVSLEPETRSTNIDKVQTERTSLVPTTAMSKSDAKAKQFDSSRVSSNPTAARSPRVSPKATPKLSPKPAIKDVNGTRSIKVESEISSRSVKAASLVPAPQFKTLETDLTTASRARNATKGTDVNVSQVVSDGLLNSGTRSRLVSASSARQSSASQQLISSMTDEEIRLMVEACVGSIPQDPQKPDFDAQSFLLGLESADSKCRTLQHTIFEISGDGRKTAMPPQQDHILYEELMYIVSHTFTSASGTKSTEVYLWCGDRVSDATLDDVQIFCKRDAREHNTRLEIIKQGAEHTRFLQALGGIVITRRSKSASFFMLCGRKYLGHFVFDEVDLAASNLCPGYAYLISAQFGKLYLWKGKGASAEEIGSARLIGMDLGLTGELEEVEEGGESAAFWESMTDKKLAKWSQDWRQRADNDSYPTSLYRVEHEKPKLLGNLWSLARPSSPNKSMAPKVACEHISPYNQRSLEGSSVHILDTYCTLYILINERCTGKAAEFISAVHIVQDIAMLLPSAQDRPALPTCFVCIGEPPIDVKAAFRKWTNDLYAAVHGSSNLCVPVAQIISALKL